MILDVAHSGWQTVETPRRPSVCGRCANAQCRLNKHIRSKPDEDPGDRDTGGYVGICSIPAFLGGKGDIKAMLDHIDYVVKHYGRGLCDDPRTRPARPIAGRRARRS